MADSMEILQCIRHLCTWSATNPYPDPSALWNPAGLPPANVETTERTRFGLSLYDGCLSRRLTVSRASGVSAEACATNRVEVGISRCICIPSLYEGCVRISRASGVSAEAWATIRVEVRISRCVCIPISIWYDECVSRRLTVSRASGVSAEACAKKRVEVGISRCTSIYILYEGCVSRRLTVSRASGVSAEACARQSIYMGTN